ncbi:MAG TPA: hypothetical protein VLF61_01625 [Rhabdochlamydiaceae bacterium]|nr:hypothetical protein [Rhabdochlamydiaceae bacterium]
MESPRRRLSLQRIQSPSKAKEPADTKKMGASWLALDQAYKKKGITDFTMSIGDPIAYQNLKSVLTGVVLDGDDSGDLEVAAVTNKVNLATARKYRDALVKLKQESAPKEKFVAIAREYSIDSSYLMRLYNDLVVKPKGK